MKKIKALEVLERLKENKENLKQYSCSECKYTDFEYDTSKIKLSDNKDLSIIENALLALQELYRMYKWEVKQNKVPYEDCLNEFSLLDNSTNIPWSISKERYDLFKEVFEE